MTNEIFVQLIKHLSISFAESTVNSRKNAMETSREKLKGELKH